MQPIVKLVIAGAAMFATLGLIAGLSGCPLPAKIDKKKVKKTE